MSCFVQFFSLAAIIFVLASFCFKAYNYFTDRSKHMWTISELLLGVGFLFLVVDTLYLEWKLGILVAMLVVARTGYFYLQYRRWQD